MGYLGIRDVFMDIPCAFAVSGVVCDSICRTLAVYGCRLAAKGMTMIASMFRCLFEYAETVVEV